LHYYTPICHRQEALTFTAGRSSVGFGFGFGVAWWSVFTKALAILGDSRFDFFATDLQSV